MRSGDLLVRVVLQGARAGFSQKFRAAVHVQFRCGTWSSERTELVPGGLRDRGSHGSIAFDPEEKPSRWGDAES